MSTPWVIFDGDDTLWDTIGLYDDALAGLGSLARDYGLDSDEVIDWAQARDVVNAATMGYSMNRFPTTLAQAAQHWMPGSGADEIALSLGYSVFSSAASPRSGASELFDQLKSSGYRLMLLTAGEHGVQVKRISDYALRDSFDQARIVPAKTAQTYLDVIREFDIDAGASWMVGDSLRSDIVPSTQAGFNAVLYDTRNWSGYEASGLELPTGAHSARSLAEVAALIAAPRPTLVLV